MFVMLVMIVTTSTNLSANGLGKYSNLPSNPPKITDEVFYHAIVAESSKSAESEVMDTVNRYLSIVAGAAAVILALFGFFGFSQVRELRTNFKESIRNELERELRTDEEFRRQIVKEVEKDVSSDIKQDISRIQQLIDTSKLLALADRIRSKSSFSNEERDELLNSLLRLKEASTITTTFEFKEALRLSVSLFYQAGIWSQLDVLENNLQDTFLSDINIISTMIEGYSIRVLGETIIIQEDRVTAEEKLIIYINAASSRNYKEFAYPYLAALWYWRGHPREKIERLFLEAKEFTSSELSSFLTLLEKLQNPANITSKHADAPTYKAIAAKFSAVCKEFSIEIEELRNEMKHL